METSTIKIGSDLDYVTALLTKGDLMKHSQETEHSLYCKNAVLGRSCGAVG